jgi:PPOX class probable F420-dependent enzyme
MVIDEKFLDLLTEKKSFAHFVTLMEDGSPQVSPVWVDYDGEFVLVNTAKGRTKEKNLRTNKHVALSILDPDLSYRFLGIRGRVVEVTKEGADAHIDKLAKKYLGQDIYPNRAPGEVRVLVKIKPEHVYGMG